MAKNKLWFRAKRYGWGWYPISWQGWILTFFYIAALICYAFSIDPTTHSTSDFLIKYAFFFIALSIPFLLICYQKGEHPHWRWGHYKR